MRGQPPIFFPRTATDYSVYFTRSSAAAARKTTYVFRCNPVRTIQYIGSYLTSCLHACKTHDCINTPQCVTAVQGRSRSLIFNFGTIRKRLRYATWSPFLRYGQLKAEIATFLEPLSFNAFVLGKMKLELRGYPSAKRLVIVEYSTIEVVEIVAASTMPSNKYKCKNLPV